MNNTKHTPTPYRIGDAGMTVFGPPNGNPAPQVVCELRRKSDGPFLIAACNAHDALVKALRELTDKTRALWLEASVEGESLTAAEIAVESAMIQARAALAMIQARAALAKVQS